MQVSPPLPGGRSAQSYCPHVAGGDSGGVHSTVRERWTNRDPALVEGMKTLGGYADRTVACLRAGDFGGLAELMDLNFAMRRRLYGDDVVGATNITAVGLANKLGFAAKFTGSGGAILCLHRNTFSDW